MVYNKVRTILTRFGTIDDEAKKLYGPVLVLNYGKGERMLKVEISVRQYPNHYEMRSLAGTDIRVMTMPDMFAHKLCAMGERLSPRDIFDVWFFLQNHTEINEEIVVLRTGKCGRVCRLVRGACEGDKSKAPDAGSWRGARRHENKELCQE